MAIAADTPVPTPNGWALASDLRPGDFLFLPRGGLCQIGSVQTFIPAECYTAHFDDGLQITGDSRLSFAFQDRVWRTHHNDWFRNQHSKFAKKKFRRPLKICQIGQLFREPLVDRRNRKKWSLQTVAPLEYPQVDLPVPPYVFGLWIGSVTSTGKHYIGRKNFDKMQRTVRRYGFNLTRNKGRDAQFFFRPGVRESFTFAHTPIPDIVPQSYLEADVQSRKLLLEGLIDARDAKNVVGNPEVYGIYDIWRSIRRKQQLVESLGYKSRLTTQSKNSRFYLEFEKNSITPEKTRRFLTKIDKIAPKQCVHIVVEGEFVAGEGFLAVC